MRLFPVCTHTRVHDKGWENAKNASGRSAPHPKGDASFAQGWEDGVDYSRSRKPR
jgi:hypothetical protein